MTGTKQSARKFIVGKASSKQLATRSVRESVLSTTGFKNLITTGQNPCVSRNPSLQEIDQASDLEVSFPGVDEEDHLGFQN